MNYGEARDTTLKIINQYSITGQKVAMTYNGQNDTILRIPAFINDAQLIIARGPRRIEAALDLSRTEFDDVGGMSRYVFPEDMLEPIPGGLLRVESGETSLFSGYTILDENYFLVPKDVSGSLFLRYYRRPRRLPGAPDDATPLDNVAIAQEPVPYYAAAMLLLSEDAFANSVVFNMWQDKLNDLTKLPQAERHIIRNAYDIGGWGDY